MLFKKNDRLLDYAELSGSIQFNSVKKTIRVVEEQDLVPVLGNELYSLLNTAYQLITDEASLSAVNIALLDRCRCIIGPMLCYRYTPKSEVKVSDAGAQRMETGTNKTAYQNQIVNFREQNLREAEVATELLLQFLETNKDAYPEWVSSEAFADYRSLFIKSGNDFNKLFTSSSPYRNYWAMRSKMLDVEQNNIRILLGDTLFNALKAKDADAAGVFTDKEKDLLFKVKKVIAYLTVSFSIPFLNVRIDANGITVMSAGGRAQNDDLAKKGAAGNPALNIIIEKSEAAAKSWINNVEKFLNDNVTDFVGWPLMPVTAEVVTDDCDDHRYNGTDCFNEERTGSFGLV